MKKINITNNTINTSSEDEKYTPPQYKKMPEWIFLTQEQKDLMAKEDPKALDRAASGLFKQDKWNKFFEVCDEGDTKLSLEMQYDWSDKAPKSWGCDFLGGKFINFLADGIPTGWRLMKWDDEYLFDFREKQEEEDKKNATKEKFSDIDFWWNEIRKVNKEGLRHMMNDDEFCAEIMDKAEAENKLMDITRMLVIYDHSVEEKRQWLRHGEFKISRMSDFEICGLLDESLHIGDTVFFDGEEYVYEPFYKDEINKIIKGCAYRSGDDHFTRVHKDVFGNEVAEKPQFVSRWNLHDLAF